MTEARNFYDAMTNAFPSLYGRWLDEREHEDFADYKHAMQKACVVHGVIYVKMTKRPFALTFKTPTGTFVMKCTSREYSYRQIA